MGRMLVLLDTNFLFLPHQKRLDVFSELQNVIPEAHELITLSTVVSEMQALSSLKNDDGVAARVGLELLGRNGVRVIEASGGADDSILEYATRNPREVIVCTNDAGLKNKLKRKGVQLLVLRSKTHLMRL